MLELLAYAKGNRSPDGFLVKKEGQQELEGWKGTLLLGVTLLKSPVRLPVAQQHPAVILLAQAQSVALKDIIGLLQSISALSP